MSRKATDIFSEWASIGRDEGCKKIIGMLLKICSKRLSKNNPNHFHLLMLDVEMDGP